MHGDEGLHVARLHRSLARRRPPATGGLHHRAWRRGLLRAQTHPYRPHSGPCLGSSPRSIVRRNPRSRRASRPRAGPQTPDSRPSCLPGQGARWPSDPLPTMPITLVDAARRRLGARMTPERMAVLVAGWVRCYTRNLPAPIPAGSTRPTPTSTTTSRMNAPTGPAIGTSLSASPPAWSVAWPPTPHRAAGRSRGPATRRTRGRPA